MHAEWTKFRTVRGWVIAVLVTIAAITAFVFLASDVSGGCAGAMRQQRASPAACPAQPTGPGGVPVLDAFYFAHQPVTGNGTITVQVTSLTGQVASAGNGGPRWAGGLQPWSKAGIIIKENTSQGSAYAAMMVTGSNGVRMQWDYVNDTPGLAGSVSASSPRWLRLVRDGGTITGYDSADGTHWTLVGTATLPGLTSTVQAGLFAAGSSDDSNFCTRATGVFRHIGLSWPATGWTGTNVGGAGPNARRASARHAPPERRHDHRSRFRRHQPRRRERVQRKWSIPPAGAGRDVLRADPADRGGRDVHHRRVPARADPRLADRRTPPRPAAGRQGRRDRRGRFRRRAGRRHPRARRRHAPAAPGRQPAMAGFAAHRGTDGRRHRGAARRGRGARARDRHHRAAQRAGGRHRDRGDLRPVSARLRPAVRVAARQRPGRGGGWPLQITPAAALSVQQAVPQFHQLIAIYTPDDGYYPLAPWAGLAVECAWAAAALALAFFLLRRRDA